MNTTVVVHGILQPDGTLHLDQTPNLPPGPVVVTMQTAPGPTPTVRCLADVIDEIRQGQLARAFQGRAPEDIEAVRKEGEADYEKRMQATHPTSTSAAGGS